MTKPQNNNQANNRQSSANPKKQTTKQSKALWGGRFSTKASDVMLAIGESISYDNKLWPYDIIGSMAHVRMLAASQILPEKECAQIVLGLAEVAKILTAGGLEYKFELEDIHMHVETALTDAIGELGKKLHTARSRNDQVAVDVHLYLKDNIAQQIELCEDLLADLYQKSLENLDVIMPGYTHLQVAQPIRAAHWFLAWFWKFERILERLYAAFERCDLMPLGSGAMAGVNYATKREVSAELLGFSGIYPNSMDAVAGRDYQFDYLYAASTCFLQISRFAEESVIFSSVEFKFFTMNDDVSTGSSIMPQKKNPDLAELLRGKSARVMAALNRAFMLVKNLPLTYNRDLQEDKENLFDAVEQTSLGLAGVNALLNGFKINPENMTRSLERGYATATDLADALVAQKQVAFRDAHHIVGSLVGKLTELNQTLSQADAATRKAIDPVLADDEFYFKAIDLALSADKKVSQAGTAKAAIVEQQKLAKKAIVKWHGKRKTLALAKLDRQVHIDWAQSILA